MLAREALYSPVTSSVAFRGEFDEEYPSCVEILQTDHLWSILKDAAYVEQMSSFTWNGKRESVLDYFLIQFTNI